MPQGNFSPNFPLRPIFAAYNTTSLKLAYTLVPCLAPLTTNSYTVLSVGIIVLNGFYSIDKDNFIGLTKHSLKTMFSFSLSCSLFIFNNRIDT